LSVENRKGACNNIVNLAVVSSFGLRVLRSKTPPTQHAPDWRVRAAFSNVFFAQADSVKMALPQPSRQQVMQAVGL